MSRFDYEASRKLTEQDVSFNALIMAACRRADTINAVKLQLVFPEIYSEVQERYDAPGGALPGD